MRGYKDMAYKKKISIALRKIAVCSIAIFFIAPLVMQRYARVSLAEHIEVGNGDVHANQVEQASWEKTGYTRLMDAARDGNLDDVKRYIAAGDDLNAVSLDKDQTTVSSNGYAKGNDGLALRNTALMIAIYNTNFTSNFPAAQMLINAGANVRLANSNGDTPIHYTMQRIYRPGNFDTTSHINQRAVSAQVECLINAAPTLSDREDLMINLIKHGADINAQNNQGYTMAHIAVLNNDGQWIGRLKMDYGSIIDFQVKANLTSCLSQTQLAGTPIKDCGQCLTPIQLAGLSAGTCTGNSNIYTYYLNNNEQYPLRILGANDRDIMGFTGFMLAVIWEGTKKIKDPSYDSSQDPLHRNYTVDLLMRDADLNAKTNNYVQGSCSWDMQNTVLHIALLHQLPDMIKTILDGAKKFGKSIDVNAKNGSYTLSNGFSIGGDAPLHYALKLQEALAKNKDARNNVVRYLLDGGADINIQNNNGDTLLHLAVKEQATDLINFLITTYYLPVIQDPRQQLNLAVENKVVAGSGAARGQTALELAQSLKFNDIASLISQAIAKKQAATKQSISQ